MEKLADIGVFEGLQNTCTAKNAGSGSSNKSFGTVDDVPVMNVNVPLGIHEFIRQLDKLGWGDYNERYLNTLGSAGGWKRLDRCLSALFSKHPELDSLADAAKCIVANKEWLEIEMGCDPETAGTAEAFHLKTGIRLYTGSADDEDLDSEE